MSTQSSSKQIKSKYCANISEGLKLATWLQGDQPKDLTTVKRVIKIFRDHNQSSLCECIAKGSNLLILAVSSYHLFFISLQDYASQIEKEEKKCEPDVYLDAEVNQDDESIAGSQLPNVEASKPSRYGANLLQQFVNTNCQQTILKPLKQCIQYLRQAFTVVKTIPTKLLEGLRINTLLLTAHNIFNCYYQPDYQYHCARLLIELAGKVLPDEKESLLTAYHILIRLYLNFNIVSKAKKYLGIAQKTMNQMRIKNFESYQAGLIFLDQCEIELRMGAVEESGIKLKKYLQSDYLKKLTLNRFHLKGLALLLASKFPSSYQFSSDFSEFIEPLHISLTILKRWHRNLLQLPPKESDKPSESTEDDHAWFKYEIYAFSMNVLSLTKTFYLNVGFPFELSPFFNCLLSLSRRNCFLIWSLKLLKTGAIIDLKCDKMKPALMKLENGITVLTSFSSMKTNQAPESSPDEQQSNFSSPSKLKSNLLNAYTDMDIELAGDDDDIDDNDAYGGSHYSKNVATDRCIHDLGDIRVWEVEQVLRKGISKNGDHDDIVEEPTFAKMLDSVGPYLPFPYNIYFMDLLITFSFSKRNFGKELIEKMEEIIFSFSNSHDLMFQKLIKFLHISDDEFNPKLVPEIFILKLRMANMLTDYYSEKNEFSSIVSLCSSFLPNIVGPYFGLAVTDYIGRLLFKLVCAKNALLNLKPSFPEFDAKEIQEKMIRPVLACKTPSPVRSKPKDKINKMNAPKREVNYKMEEFRDYAKSLHNIPNPPKKQAPRKSTRNSSKQSSISSDKVANSTDSDIVIISENIKPPTSAQRKSVRASSQKSRISTLSTSSNNNNNKQIESLSKSKSKSVACPIESLTKAIDCITIDDQIDDDGDGDGDGDVFICHKNLISQFIGGQSDIINNINSLKNLSVYYSNHPPIDIYPDLHYQLFQLYSSSANRKKKSSEASYHLHESSNSAMIRYRALFTSENKKRIKVPMELSLDNLIFNPIEDVNFHNLNKQTQIIPETWRIVQIFSYPNNQSDKGIPDLLISRWQKNKRTVIIKIKGNPEKFTRNFMEEFYEIIQLSNASIRKQDSQTFWSARTALDHRLNMLLQSVADTWLGPFKSLLMGDTQDSKLRDFRAALKKNINEFFDSNLCRDEDLFDCIIESFPTLSKQQFETAMCLLFSQFSFTILEECFHNCMEIYETFYCDEEKKDLLMKVNFEPIGLIVNKPLEGFPFESLPNVICTNQQVFRIPSLRFLIALLETHLKKDKLYTQGVDPHNVYYLLNPTNNLMKTEKRFKDKFLSQRHWKGCISDPPDWKHLKSSLNKSDLYIFFGHGAGSRYYKSIPEGIDSVVFRAAALIVGCCSGKLFIDGSMFDSFGMPYRFMVNGCPTYLGVLWDVTDGDIDRFADKLLSLWLPNWIGNESKDLNKKQMSDNILALTKALLHARSACRFTCLTGAAPVIYGLPISLSLSKR